MSYSSALLALVGLLSATAAQAQAQAVTAQSPAPATPAPTPAPTPAFREISLAPNAEVVLTPNDTVSSKSVKVGDKVRLATRFDVMQDGYVVIPRGTIGEATVSYRTGKGAFGKSAKMEIEFNWLDLNGRRIPLSGKYRQEGEGNTGAAVGAVVAVGVFGAFVTGHSATLTNGQELRTHTVEPLVFDVPANLAPVPVANLAAPPPVAQAVVVMSASPAAAPVAKPALTTPAVVTPAVATPAVATTTANAIVPAVSKQ